MAVTTKAKIMTARDESLMSFIGNAGIASLDQIHRRHWPQALVQTARDRLLQLEKAGWIKQEYVDVRQRGEMVFTLTDKGAAQFTAAERKNFTIGLPSHKELKQQLLGQDARIEIEKQLAARGGKLLGWRSERELRSKFYREQAHYNREHGNAWNQKAPSYSDRPKIDDIADAQVVIIDQEGQEQTLDIEIDGQYYGKMLDSKIESFTKSNKPSLWVTTEKRASRINQAFADHPNVIILVV